MSSIAFCADQKDVYEILYSKDALKLPNEIHSNVLSLLSVCCLVKELTRKIVSIRVISSLRVILNCNYTSGLLSHYCQMFCNLQL